VGVRLLPRLRLLSLRLLSLLRIARRLIDERANDAIDLRLRGEGARDQQCES
jgi:hypothetical protein